MNASISQNKQILQCVAMNVTLIYSLLAYSSIKQRHFSGVYVSLQCIEVYSHRIFFTLLKFILATVSFSVCLVCRWSSRDQHQSMSGLLSVPSLPTLLPGTQLHLCSPFFYAVTYSFAWFAKIMCGTSDMTKILACVHSLNVYKSSQGKILQ